jgi:nucleotide-binding universal stress UspA family protein
MTNSIVVGTDGSPSAERAVEWAAAEAERRGCRLHIVYAARLRERVLTPGAGCLGSLADAGDPILVHAAELVAKAVPELAVTTQLVPEAPRSALREQAERAVEVVVGHRGHDGSAGLLLGSTSLSLAGRTSCPLVIVRGEAGDERDEVVVGVDLRDGESERVLAYAFEAASLRGAWVRVVHSWEVPPTLFNGAYPVTVRQALARAQNRLADAAAPWRTRYPNVRAIEETPPGRPIDELIKRSGRADLLVVGSRRHGATRHLGSISHGVIHHAECPVAVIASVRGSDGPSSGEGPERTN